MEDDEGTNQVQIIDDDGEFTDVMDKVVKDWHFANRGFDYKVIAILGCQSSGKSTLLNLLFGTKFAVMDKSKGRQQTTQGIWLSRSGHSDILVFDVEGTDSKERGDASVSFERKTSLFSLALSEILLINMWVHDIGRLQAGNLTLLKVVLELNLQLFQKRKASKTLLLFVLRDWDGDVALPTLQEQLNQDLRNIWGELQKPDEFKDSDITEFFEFAHVALPHKVYNYKDFETEVIKLRGRLTNPDNNDYLWKREFKTDVPADGFPIYIRSIWEVIKHNKDLDIPSQKEMMAIYRCDEISNEVYAGFSEKVLALSNILRSGEIIPNFGQTSTEILSSSFGEYQSPASRYHKEVSQKKGEELMNKMKKDLFALFVDLISKFKSMALSHFEKMVKETIPNDTIIIDSFAEVMGKLKDSIILEFTESASSVIPEQCRDEWDFRSDLISLEKLINKDINSIREAQILRFIDLILKKSMKVIVIEPLEDLLDQAKPDMWTQIRALYKVAIEKIVIRLQKKLEEFDCPIDDTQRFVSNTSDNLTQLFTSTITSRTKSLQNELLKKFESIFKFDEKGLPRKWEKHVNITEIYERAIDATIPLIELFSVIQLDDNVDYDDFDNVPPESIINTKREQLQIRNTFKQTADSMLTSARAEQDKNNVTTQIPTYFIILFLIFAFDDLWPIISSPILFPIVLFLTLSAVLIWYLGMTSFVLSAGRATLNQAWAQGEGYFRTMMAPKADNNNNLIKPKSD